MTIQAAVIGHPIKHSLSPAIFEFLSKELGTVSLRYQALEVRPQELKPFLDAVRGREDWIGLNVTIPHKESITWLIDGISPGAKALGAVNVVQIKNKKIFGHNTDIIGIQESIRERDLNLKGRSVVILGAGGAARAAAYACAQSGSHSVFVVNRTLARAEAIAQDFAMHFPKTRFAALSALDSLDPSKIALVIQATPVGMSKGATPEPSVESTGQDATLSLFNELFEIIKPETLAFDLIYRPEHTPFMIAAEQRGCPTMSGLSMLIGQALATWEIWFEPLAAKEELKTKLTSFLRQQLGAAR